MNYLGPQFINLKWSNIFPHHEILYVSVIDKNDQAGFRIDLQLKDLRLASEAAFESGVPLPGLSLVQTLYLESRAHNEGKNGNQSLFKTYDRMTNQK